MKKYSFSDESTHLIFNSATQHQRHGTLSSSIFNLTASSVGAGVLLLPFSFRCSGLLLGIGMLAFIGIMSFTSLRLLEKSCRLTESSVYTFDGVAGYFYGDNMRKFVQLNMLVLLFGAVVTFLVLFLDNIVPALQILFGASTHWFIQDILFSRWFLLILACVSIFPLSLSSELHSLRHSSLIVILSILYLFIIIVSTAMNKIWDGEVQVKLFSINEQFLYTFSVQSLSYCCQFNILPLFAELRNPTVKRMKKLQMSSMGLCFLLYSCFGIFGYIAFGSATPGDVLNAYSPRIEVAFGRMVLAIALLLKCPLVMIPLRIALKESQVVSCLIDSHGNYFTIATSVLVLFFATLVAICIPNIELVYGFLGATAGSMICFILPAVIYLGTSASKQDKIPAIFTLILGIIAMISSIIVTLSPDTNEIQ